MDRRTYLALAGSGLVSLAGCSGGGGGNAATETETATPTPTSTPTQTPTDTPTPTPTPEPANIALDQYEAPTEVEIGEEFDVTISVTNTGGQSTTYSAPVYLKTTDTSWQEVGSLDFGSVDPGETKQVTTEPFSLSYINRYEIRIGQSSQTAAIQTVSSRQNWGSTFETPEGYVIRVDEPEFTGAYRYETYSGDIEEQEPEDGGQWVFVNVYVKNQTGSGSYSPTGFALLSGNSQYDSRFVLNEPIDYGEPYESGELQPGIERSGYVLYAVPDSVSLSDISIAWSTTTFNGDISVRWLSNP
jgi:hypothetical protein